LKRYSINKIMASKSGPSVIRDPEMHRSICNVCTTGLRTLIVYVVPKISNVFFRWVSAFTGMCAFILYLPGIFVEHSVLDKDDEKEEEKDKLPEMSAPKTNPRELLKQLSIISVVDSTNIRTFNEFKPNNELARSESGD